MFDRIPSELRSLRQWCLWRYEHVQGSEKPTKVPYQPNGRHASVNDSSSYSSFDECINRLSVDNRYSGLGFIFTVSDPYAGIDLDNPNGDQAKVIRYQKVYDTFISYAELSISGTGVHIIVKGSVPTGVRQQGIEVYSSQRFFVFTGNVIRNESINDYSETLLQLWSALDGERKSSAVAIVNEPETKSDDEVLALARGAENGDKFAQLYDQELEGDDSAFDMALCNFLVFHSRNNAQVERLFRASVRGKRDKIKRKDYLPRTIIRARDKMQDMLTPIDIAPLQEAIKQKLAGSSNGKTTDFESVNEVSTTSPAAISIPPGLLGEIAQFIFAAAPRPIPEIAMAAAIGLMAGICGRAYNISGSGLNQYVLLLAPTGMGKEAISSGIDKIMSAIFTTNPASKDFVGPSDMASGQALVRYIDDSLTKCFVCMMDEFGLRLQSMSDPKANDAQRKLKQTLLELYQRTGKGQIFRPTIYADKQKNTLSTPCPNVTILGYSAPERFYEVLSEDMIVDGVLPRFSIIEYKGMRPPHNYDFHTVMPSFELVKQVGSLAIHSLSQMSNVNTGQQWVTIQIDDAAEKMHREFNTYCDSIYNSSVASSHKQLWSRAHLKALKLAGLIAVGCNMYSPVVTTVHLEYAIKMVCNDIRALLAKFESGETGRNNLELKQIKEIARVMSECVKTPWERNKKYFADAPQQMHYDKIVPYCYINKRLSGIAVMNENRLKASVHIKHAIQVMLEIGMIIELDKEKVAKNYNCNYRCFIIKDLTILGSNDLKRSN